MENENKKQKILLGSTKIEIDEIGTLIFVKFDLSKDEITEFETKTIQNKIKAVCELAEKKLYKYSVTYLSNKIEIEIALNKEW